MTHHDSHFWESEDKYPENPKPPPKRIIREGQIIKKGKAMNKRSWTYELARKAYEAYCGSTDWKSAITGADLPQFDNCPKAVKDGWIAVANKMILEIGK